MRIVIDVQGAQTESRFRGIGRYTLSLTQAIARNAGSHEIWLVANAQLPESIPSLRQALQGLVPQKRIRIFDVPASPHQGDWTSLAAELIREDFIAALAPDVLLVTSVFEGFRAKAVTSIGARTGGPKTAAILYDLIPLVNQEQYLHTKELRKYYFRKIDWLKRAGLLLSISESSQKEGIELLEIPADRVTNISTAVGPQFHPNSLAPEAASALRERLGIMRKIVMYAPGGFDPRKNFARLIDAYSHLSADLRTQHQLVIVGRLHPAQRQELVDLRDRCALDPEELVLPGYVEDEDLIALYSLTDLFVFPSVHEGFGLPVLEAMACGAAVIGSNCTSIPEVIGLDAALFDPLSVDSIRGKLTQALKSDEFRERLRLHGLQQARRFSWDACATKAIAALERLHARNIEVSPEQEGESLVSALAAIARRVKPEDHDLRAAAQCVAFNRGGDRTQLLLDISSLVQSDAKTGIQRVVRSLLAEFLASPPPGFDVLPIYFDGSIYRHAAQFTASVTGSTDAVGDTPINFWQDDVYLSLDLIMHLTPQVHGLHEDLSARGLKLYFIVYDMLLIQHPEWWPAEMATQFNIWLTHVSEVATGLVCISRAVADEVADWLKATPPSRVGDGPQIASFHLGADISNSLPTQGIPASASHVLEQMAARKTFLMVGTIEPRKGCAQVMAAFDLLWEQGNDVNLVIVGKRGWLVDELIHRISSHRENGRRLLWMEGISDEYLERIYHDSDCQIAASEGEGFGLPLIEAALHGLPIIARDIPVFREVAGDHALYFSGKDAKDVAEALRTWLSQFAINAHPKSAGMPWLTWKQSAKNLLSLILKTSLP